MNAKTEAAVMKHGESVLEAFPRATERDPLQLCRKLRKLEREGEALALRICNGPELDFGREEGIQADILERVNAVLGNESGAVPVFVNQDPRGYSLKIREEWTRAHNRTKSSVGKPQLYVDWGGYGIIAPDLSEGK